MSSWNAAVLAGAVVSSPVYEDNRRGKNWLAVIEADPLMLGGVYRRWLPRARGEFRYMVGTRRHVVGPATMNDPKSHSSGPVCHHEMRSGPVS